MSGKHIPAIPGGMGGMIWPDCAANAEPVHASDKLAQIVRQLAAAGISRGILSRLSDVTVDVRHMERVCDTLTERQFAAERELARPGTNLLPFRSA